MGSARQRRRRFPLDARAGATLISTLLLALGIAISEPAWAKDVHPALARLVPHAALSDRFLTYRPGAEPVVNLFVRGTIPRGDLEGEGIEVNTWTSAGMTVRCPLSRFSLLQSLPGISAIQPAGRCRLYLDR
ncbi:MAG: hypothetical protein E6K79_11255, partial [Candidatus Eisenbacteria bacterium]